MTGPVVILGLGFTTRRLAWRLRQRGIQVCAVVRGAGRFAEFAAAGVQLLELGSGESASGLSHGAWPEGAVLVHSVPPVGEPGKSEIRALICEMAPRRILYISSTGVYGASTNVSEDTPAAPNDDKGRARIEEEEWIAHPERHRSHWSSLILRSAAIYGPGRGVHVRLLEGGFVKAATSRGGGGVVSRIHVDDLAAILEAGIESHVEGTWPVADENPATTEEVAGWCANRMGMVLPVAQEAYNSISGRRVDGRKIRELLGVKLKYASYRAGTEASLAEERGHPVGG